MTWAGERLAVVSLGMSCQSAVQIRHQADIFTARGYTGQATNAYCDWLIAAPSATATLLRDGMPPLTRRDIISPNGRPIDARYNSILWHEFMPNHDADIYDIDGMFDDVAQKRVFLADRLRALSQTPELLFVWSNTQNGLAEISADHGIDLRFSQPVATEIIEAAERLAGRSAHFLFFVHPALWEPFAAPVRSTVFVASPETNSWQGDDNQWRDALTLALGEMAYPR